MKIKHILVTTDLSETARVAFSHAAGFARSFGAHVTLLHVDDLGDSEVMGWENDEVEEYVQNVLQLRIQLLEKSRQELANFGVTVNARMIGGSAAREILKFARENQVDLIVLAKHGLSGFKRLLLGSVSKKVIRKADVPVLLVDAEKKPTSSPNVYRTLMTTTDFSKDSERGLHATLELANALDAHVKVVNVVKVPLPLVTIPGESPVTWPPTHLAFLQEHYQERLARLLAEQGNSKLSYHVESSNAVAETLVEVADKVKADLLVMPSHGKGAVVSALVGSTTMRVLKLINRPVLLMSPRFLEGKRLHGEQEQEVDDEATGLVPSPA